MKEKESTMKCIVDDDVVLSRPLEGPLSAHIAGFAKWACDEGYASPSRWRKVLLATGFSRWLGQQAVSLCRVSSEHVALYLRSRARRVQIQRGGCRRIETVHRLATPSGRGPSCMHLPRNNSPSESFVPM